MNSTFSHRLEDISQNTTLERQNSIVGTPPSTLMALPTIPEAAMPSTLPPLPPKRLSKSSTPEVMLLHYRITLSLRNQSINFHANRSYAE